LNRRRLGIVDLGSNSARLVVYDLAPGRGFRLADEIREVVGLGEGLAGRGRMRASTMRKAVTALRSFADYARATDLPLHVIATSAVREASNGGELLASLNRLGLDVSVLSGRDEANLGVIAVANSFSQTDAWVLDLGGGSAQVSLMRDRELAHGAAYPLGALRCSEGFLSTDPVRRRDVRALEQEVDIQLADVLPAMAEGPNTIIAMGGTVRNLARAAARAGAYPLPSLHGYRLTRDALENLTDRMIVLRARARGKIPGINGYRARTILAGAVVFRQILRRSGSAALTISAVGVREGSLYRELLEPPHLLADVRRFSIDNLLWQYPQPAAHVERVQHLAGRVFEELEPLHALPAEDRTLLDAAARVHDIGKAISYRDHARHGAYLVAGSPLHGFSPREQALISLLVRYHRSGKPRADAYRGIVEPGDRARLRQLATCLRLAEYMERTRSSRVVDVHAEIGAGSVVLSLVCEGEPWVEYWETRRQRGAFRRAFGRKLKVRFAD
jgi:exopolyphosphatase/guanosine-5'-triphosphate,3'-diphosphate pyrophosphatase